MLPALREREDILRLLSRRSQIVVILIAGAKGFSRGPFSQERSCVYFSLGAPTSFGFKIDQARLLFSAA